MSQKPIRMTDGFRKGNIKGGQLTEADANGEWIMPEGMDTEKADEEFLSTVNRVSRPVSPDQE